MPLSKARAIGYPHYILRQQEANYAPITATIGPSARRQTPKFAFEPLMLPLRAVR
jgi:hypothetical protein